MLGCHVLKMSTSTCYGCNVDCDQCNYLGGLFDRLVCWTTDCTKMNPWPIQNVNTLCDVL